MTDFDPNNHEYAASPTYTGFGCALCGKVEEGHKAPTPRPPKVGSTFHAPGCVCGFCKMGNTRA